MMKIVLVMMMIISIICIRIRIIISIMNKTIGKLVSDSLVVQKAPTCFELN